MRFEFVAGHVALDFVATVAERTSSRHERLPEPSDLGRWLADAGIVDTPPAVTAADLTAARELREAVYAYVVHLTGGPVPPAAARGVLNRHAAAGDVTVRLDQGWRPRRTGAAGAALGAIARAALELGQDGRPDAIRWCAGPACTRPFLDRSHAGRRRWCGMTTCGDKVKAAAYRARRSGRARPVVTAGYRQTLPPRIVPS